MAEELGHLGSLEDEALDVACQRSRRQGNECQNQLSEGLLLEARTKGVRSQRLNDLRHEEERELNRVLFEDSHGVLQEQRIGLVARLEVRDGDDWRNGSPEEQPLQGDIKGGRMSATRASRNFLG